MIPQELANLLGIVSVILASISYTVIGLKSDDDKFFYAFWALVTTLLMLAGFKLLFWM